VENNKVAVTHCTSYNVEILKKALEKVFSLMDGVDNLIKPGAVVLLKPNLLSAKPPESGVDTHPNFIRALVEIFHDAGCRVLVGDSPGGRITKSEEVWQAAGYIDALRNAPCELVKFDKITWLNVGDGKIFDRIPVASVACEADVLVSIPKFKTHELTTLTGAVKNLLGLVPGAFKAEFHRRAPTPHEFAHALLDLYSVVKPHLSICDAIIGMEGDGPVAGSLRNIGRVFASFNALLHDRLMEYMMGAYDIELFRAARQRNLSVPPLTPTSILGARLEDLRLTGFRLPSSSFVHRIPAPIAHFFAKGIKVLPHIKRKNCVACGICAAACPAQAIILTGEYATIDYSKCIKCLCCFELCPHDAVGLKKSLLGRLWF